MIWQDHTHVRLLELEQRALTIEEQINLVTDRLDDLVIMLLEIQAGMRSIAANDRASEGRRNT